MKFSKAEDVLKVIRAGEDVEIVRSANRVKVTNAANFSPPLSVQEAKDIKVKTNVNFGDLPIALAKARMQILSAFLQNKDFFTVKMPLAPAEYRDDWEAAATNEINRILRNDTGYFELHRNRWNSLILHGVGPMTWRHSEKWLPQFVAMDDLRIPTDTTLDFRNLSWYAQRIGYTQIELVNEVFDKKPKNGWNKKAIAAILENYKDLNVTDPQNNYNWATNPEKMADLMKQSGGLYGSDAVPVIPLYHFYFQDEDAKGKLKWYMRVVADTTAMKGSNGTSEDFLWESKEPIADSWRHLLHCQFGDLSADTPYKYHAVRGLGFALIEPCFFSNLLRCRMVDHINSNLNTWLRTKDSSEKSRVQVQEFGDMCVVSPGVEIIPQDQRHQIDQALLESGLAQMKQLQAEASTSYTQQSDNGTAREQTAYETRVKVEEVYALMGSILLVAFTYEKQADIEICRRFLIEDSVDPDVQKFWKKMRAAKIDKQFLDIDMWEIEPVTPLGQGNPTMALSMVQQIMAVYDKLSPDAQMHALHEYFLVVTKDPAKARLFAPLKQKEPSDATQSAADRFGTLMQGIPVEPRHKHLIDQIGILIYLLSGKITLITQRDNMATLEEGQGLDNVVNHVGLLIQELSQDKQQQAAVKKFGDDLGLLTNEIKALKQRGDEARKAQAKKQQDGENAAEMAKAQATIQLAQAKIQLGEQQAQAKLHQTQIKDAHALTAKQIQAEADEHRKSEAARAEQSRQGAAAKADIDRQNSAASAEMARNDAKTLADIENSRMAAIAKVNESKPKPAAAAK